MSETLIQENTVSPAPPAPPRKRPFWKKLLRFFGWISGIFILLIGILLLLTWIYQDDVKAYVVDEVNQQVNTVIIIDPQNIDITMIRSFPDVTVEFKNIQALDAIDIPKRDTLLRAGKISLAFNILDLFHSNYSIHNIRVEDAELKMWVDKKGNDNYHFLKEDTTAVTNDTSHVVFALDEIELKNVLCSYSDKKEKTNYKVDFHSVNFTGAFGTEKYEFGTNAEFTIKNIITGESSFFEGNSGSIDLLLEIDNTTNTYQLKTGKLKLSDFGLNVSGLAQETGKSYSLDLAVKGEEINIRSALSLLPASYHEDIAGYESDGEFYLDGTVKGLYGDSSVPVIAAEFGIKPGATVARENSNVKLTDVSLSGKFSNEKGKDGLEISSFNASSAKSKFSGSFSLTNFKRPYYETKLSGDIDLTEMHQLLQIDTITEMSGRMKVSFQASGKPKKAKPSATDFRTFQTSGLLSFESISLRMKGSNEPVDSINGKLNFDGNNVSISDFTARNAGSDLLIKGSVRNLLGYLFTENEILDINGNLSSRNLDLNRLLSAQPEESSSSDTNYRLELPERLRLKLSTSVKHLAFRRFEASSVAGDIVMKNQRLTADPISFHSMDGAFSGSGMIDASENDSLLITCHADIRSVDINKLFWQMENFGQDTDAVITDKNLRGRLTSQVNFASVWSKDLYVNEKKIYTDADLSIDKGELIDFKPLYELARFIKLEELENVKFQKLSNHIEIKNRVITIPQMEINSSAANIKMSGTHDFDNMVDYHFIVDLDDLRARKAAAAKKENGEFGEVISDGEHRRRLFISMKGSLDDPDISYDRKGNIEQIKDDLNQEKQNLKQILNEEFGWFKGKDGDKKDRKKEEGGSKFILAQDEDSTPAPKDKKKKVKDEDLDDSGDY